MPVSGLSGFRPSFFVSFFALILEWFLMDFGFIIGSLFGWVFIFWLSFFEHVFGIDFSLNFGWILVSFLMFFWYLYRSHMQLSKSSKTIVFPMNFNDFTLQRNMIFDDFLDLFRYQFWHWFLMRFGIDFGSILGILKLFLCFFDIGFCIDFWINFLMENWSKMYPNQYGECILFGITFRHTCTFYLRNTYKCQKTVFPTFWNKLKEFIHTCTFYLRNTYKCVMTVFTILKKKT